MEFTEVCDFRFYQSYLPERGRFLILSYRLGFPGRFPKNGSLIDLFIFPSASIFGSNGLIRGVGLINTSFALRAKQAIVTDHPRQSQIEPIYGDRFYVRSIAPRCGPRPCSPDGLASLGRPAKFSNLVIITGHAMMGLSLSPVAGKIVGARGGGGKNAFALSRIAADRAFRVMRYADL